MKFLVILICYLSLPLSVLAYWQDEVTAIEDSVEYPLDEIYNSNNFKKARLAPIDTSAIEARYFSDETFDRLRKDSDLRYQAPPTIAENLLDRFFNWLSRQIDKFFKFSFRTPSGRFVIYVITTIIVGFIIFFILKSTGFKVFLSNKKIVGEGSEHEDENIHEMDFDALLNQALSNNDYRRGVRLLFLSALKMLSDRSLIHWEQGKTNHEYMSELKQTELVEGFNQLSYYFDYAWYGDFQVTEETYKRVQNIFTNWKSKIK
jgi:hypothetical protein